MEKTVLKGSITIIDVYDNVESDPGFRTGFGFGAVMKLADMNILFDTGGDAPTLLTNLGKAGLRPEDIDMVVLSHIHADHTGGLSGFLEKNSDLKVCVPESYPGNLKDQIVSAGAELVEVKEPAQLAEGIYSTGELGTMIKEHSLILNTEKGLVVITGCAHPGIADIVRKAKELLDEDIYLVMGGFHHPHVSVVKDFRDMGVEKAAPSHCTGHEAVQAFSKEYGNDFIQTGVGSTIIIG
ncbi:MBL fold metallo-hydrolase [Candidatus Woesearchaeota archaeon]|nr:MBL fold metallo-hydrolase [Candidatus Woesearchaeota archaeon]